MNRISVESLFSLVQAKGRPVGLKELIVQSGLHPGQRTALKRMLRDLVSDGRLVKVGKRFEVGGEAKSAPSADASLPAHPQRKSHRAPPHRDSAGARASSVGTRGSSEGNRRHSKSRNGIEGILKVHADGFGFVHPTSGEGENIFVTPENAARGLDGDRVIVELEHSRGRPSGRIVEVVGRTREMAIGVYRELRGRVFVETDVGAIVVPKTQLARSGDTVKVRLLSAPDDFRRGHELQGEVAGALGALDDLSIEVLGIAYAQGFHDEFPERAMDEAMKAAHDVTPAEIAEPLRRDIRDLPLVTIDGEDARDFDDAIWVDDHPLGFRLVVAIADVAYYVRERSALDAEALRRATSVYLPGRVIPMLPERLSNGICSLRPDEDRLCMVADMVIDSKGQTRKRDLYPAVMRSVARCTYEEVQAVLDGNEVPHRNAFRPQFQKLLKLAKILSQMREERGAIDFDLPETRVELDASGHPERMVRRDRKWSHRIVEECMLAANEAVAVFFKDRGFPTVNRYHAPPDEEKLESFAALAKAHGLKIGRGKLSSKELNAQLQELKGHPEERALNQLLLRSMMQAVYSSINGGHYGLGADDYLHFTSPIRRYPDLLVHRLLKRIWNHQSQPLDNLEQMAVQSSERERAAMKVEREVLAFYSCLLLEKRVGEVHDATVSGLSEQGFFAELDALFVDGMVRPMRWKFDSRIHRGSIGARTIKVGQKLKVRISQVNLKTRKIDLEMLASPEHGKQSALSPKERIAELRKSHSPRGEKRSGRPWEKRGKTKKNSRSGGRRR